jgi:hypothetical protein
MLLLPILIGWRSKKIWGWTPLALIAFWGASGLYALERGKYHARADKYRRMVGL